MFLRASFRCNDPFLVNKTNHGWRLLLRNVTTWIFISFIFNHRWCTKTHILSKNKQRKRSFFFFLIQANFNQGCVFLIHKKFFLKFFEVPYYTCGEGSQWWEAQVILWQLTFKRANGTLSTTLATVQSGDEWREPVNRTSSCLRTACSSTQGESGTNQVHTQTQTKAIPRISYTPVIYIEEQKLRMPFISTSHVLNNKFKTFLHSWYLSSKNRKGLHCFASCILCCGNFFFIILSSAVYHFSLACSCTHKLQIYYVYIEGYYVLLSPVEFHEKDLLLLLSDQPRPALLST